LFVADEHMVELRLAERIVNRKNRSPGITKDVADAEPSERFAEYLRTSHLHSVLPEETGVGPDEKLDGTVVMAPSDEDDTSRAYLAITP
jgi:hypothetical protein